MIKYKIYLLIYLIIALFTINIVKATTLPLIGKLIYLDAGHGGRDPGAIYKGIKESDINLKIVKELEKELSKLGASVALTREGDYDLATTTINRKRSDLNKKIKMINESKADLYLSIHLNADYDSSWYGAQTFYDDVNDKNQIIAEVIQAQLKKDLKTRRVYKQIKDIYLNRNIEVPGALIEVGFLSNPNERYLLQTKKYQKKVSKSISNAVVDYLTAP